MIVGRIRKPHGVFGELKVAVKVDDPDRFYDLDRVFVSRNAEDVNPVELTVTGVRFHRQDALLTFEGYASREKSAELNTQWLFVALEDAVPLEDDELYTFQMIGMDVVTEEGQSIGTVKSIFETGANDVLVVKRDTDEVLIPDIPDVIRKIDVEAKAITVRLLDGLLPE